MGVLSCTINDVAYPVKHDMSGNAIQSTKTLGVRGLLTITIVDTAGAFIFQRGDRIAVSDSITGDFYTGFIQSDQQTPYGPASTAIDHLLTCFDKWYYLDKGANTTNYTGWYAGDIVTDFVVNGQPGLEGATVAAGLRRDATTTQWNQGILSGVVGASNVGDGDLELAPSGSNVTYSESTTAQFAAGSLTNLVATDNTLSPTTTPAIKMVSTLNSGQTSGTIVSVLIWTGSAAVNTTASSATFLNYDIFIDPTSPQATASLNCYFSDGSSTSATATIVGGSVDEQFILPQATNDLTGLATIGWYAHGFAIGTQFHGKTVVAVSFDVAGTQPGTYTAYVRNINFTDVNGTPFATIFSNSLNVNPPQQLQNYGYVNTVLSVVQTYDMYNFPIEALYGARCIKFTNAISVDAVKLLRSSYISWTVIEPANTQLVVKYSFDNNAYIACTNNAPLPDLPAGFDLTGKVIYLEYAFFALQGANPEVSPILESVQLNLYTSFQATKSDVSYVVDTQAGWNAGTLTNITANSASEIVLSGVIRNWDDGNFSNQSFYSSGTNIQEQSPNNRAFTIWANPSGSNTIEAKSRLDFAGQWQNFTSEVDIKLDPADPVQRGFVYRTTNWQNHSGSAAYYVWVTTGFVALGKGTNSVSSAATQQTLIADVLPTYAASSWHRLKIVVSGSNHKVYVDNVLLINATDSTYSATGYIGLYTADGGSSATTGYTIFFDNFGVVSALSGTWLSPSQSLASATTYGTSTITWRDKSPSYNGQSNTSILVEVTYNGGSTWATCTNGAALPGLTVGQSLSGVSAQFRVTLSTSMAGSLSAIDNLVVRVLGQYSASGTRSTAPMGIDYVVRANQSGFGTASDGQSYVKVGTGTDAVASNKLTITNTTGDVHEKFGSRTWNDEDATIRFSLSASTVIGGEELRYTDTNNYYRLAASTTALSIIKKSNGVSTTLKTVSVTLSTGTLYYLRFRVVGFGPTSLYGRVWASGVLEPTSWTATITD